MTLRTLLVSGCALGLVFSACATTDSATLIVGAPLALTGDVAPEAQQTRDGYNFCQQVINQRGGVRVADDTYRLEIVIEDDESTPDITAEIVDELDDRGIDFVLGPYGSASTHAAAAAVEKTGQIMVQGAGADDEIFAKGYRNTFGVLAAASQFLSSIIHAVDELADPRPQTVAIISADDAFSVTAAEAGVAEAKALGFEVVAHEVVPSGSGDVSPALMRVRGEDPDLILGAAHLTEEVAIIEQSRELGISPSGGFGLAVALPLPDFVETLGSSAEYVLGPVQWGGTPAFGGQGPIFGSAADYAEAFERVIGQTPTYYNANATGACLALVLAIEQAGTLDPVDVREELVALDIDSFLGRIHFEENGLNVAKPLAVVQVQDGELAIVWPENDRVQPLRWPTPSFDERGS